MGLVLACEDHSAADLVALGCAGEERGFGFCFLSDHFHPWSVRDGHSSNIWPVLGALACQTKSVGLVSAVTCPILRIHPTTLAQAASTVFHLSQGRFVLGLGTGERLNEQIQGQPFPAFSERLARVRESIALVRLLLKGEEVTESGRYFSVNRAQLFDPAAELPIMVAASGERASGMAAECADGLICLGAREELLKVFESRGPRKRPGLAQLSVCWGKDEAAAIRTAHRYFPHVALDGTLFAQLATPLECDRAVSGITEDDVGAAIVCGPDPLPYRRAIEECYEAGFDAVALHQIGPDQRGFLEWWGEELKPLL